ncbi:uncharacterized protein [Littorina saxatilis]|uniref:uncharacterized protein n=1 Tax=Littorina saxatilis TaxID=31220 RepID=UPI0038B4922A
MTEALNCIIKIKLIHNRETDFRTNSPRKQEDYCNCSVFPVISTFDTTTVNSQTMVELEQANLQDEETPAAATTGDNKGVKTDYDRKPGDVLEKDVALLFVNILVSLMMVSQIVSMPKSDKCKEQTGDKETAENSPLPKSPQSPCNCKQEINETKKSPKKPKPKHSKKKKMAQKVSKSDSNNFTSTFSSLLACMNIIGKVKCTKISNTCMFTIPMCLVFLTFSGHVVLSAPVELEIDQALYIQCKEKFEEIRHCPHFDREYDHLNQVCCGSIQGKVLHCLSHSDENKKKEILSVSCFPDTEVEPGYVIDITFNNGSPQKCLIPCEAGHFQPDYKRSSSIRYPYCHEPKIQCSGEDKRQLFCNGGTVKDDQCMCMPGFEPHNWKTSQSKCTQGFTSTDICHCVEAPCPSGLKRNIDQRWQCPEELISINYTCVDAEENMTTKPGIFSPSNAPDTLVTRKSIVTVYPVTTSNTETPKPEEPTGLLHLLLVIPCIALLVLIFAIAVYAFECNKSGHYRLPAN